MINKKYFKKLLALLVVLCIPAQPVLCLYQQIEQINIKSFDQKLQDECPQGVDVFDTIIEKQKNATSFANRSAVFAMMRDYEEHYPVKNNEVIGEAEWQALNLLMGTNSKPDLLLGNKINNAELELGRVELLALIANPTVATSDINKRQTVIKELVENNVLFEKVRECFKKLKKSEPLLYSFWQNDEFDGHIKQFMATGSVVGFASEYSGLRAQIETNSTALQTTLLASQGELLFSSAQGLTELAVPLILLALKGYPALALEERAKEWFGQDRNPVRPSVLSFPGIVDRGWSWFRGEDSRQAAVKVVVGFGLCAQGAMTLTNSYLKYKTSKTLLKFIQLKLKVVAEFVAALQELEELIKNSPALQESFDGLDDLNETLHTWRELSPEFNKFMSYLNTDTFKSDFSILSNAGRILASYFLMAQHKAKLLPGLRALGRMDAYLSCAHLFNEGKDRDNTWSFVNLVESPTPCFKAQDCWNPFFDHTKAVSNSLCVGFDGFPKSAIITGPNAGGKSSNIKSMGIMLLLGQSIGIVPGQLTCTPFAKIVTHMNIVDDMAEGKSHFVASVIDTRRPVKIVKSASPGEFIAIITDEMFNDTRREEGQAAAFSLVELLGKHPQTICLSATHFPLLTELEQMYPQLFKNYKVSVNYEQGKIIYPFKLEPGISHQNVAFDILRQEGFDDEFLARAREVIAWEKN